MEIKDIAQLIIFSMIVHISSIASGIALFIHKDVTGFLKFGFIAVVALSGLCMLLSILALGSPANAVSSKLSFLTGLFILNTLLGGGSSAAGIARGSQYLEYVMKDTQVTIAVCVVAFCMIVYLLLAFLMIRANESIGALRRAKLLTGTSLWAHMNGDTGGSGSNSSEYESDREYSRNKSSKKPSFSNKKRSKKNRASTSESPSETEPILKSGGAIARAVQYV